MDRKLKGREYFYISSMLFGLFFGAGNLIFPVHMGQEAGSNVFLANIGFLITGVGLPFLGIIAMGISKSEGLFDMASRVSKKYAYIFTILLYLVIGPFFALPRLATTSFEIGIAPFVEESNIGIVLAIFSIAFFVIACFYARKSSKLLIYVGKVLNPLFLVLLLILFVIAFINPMGTISEIAVQSSYQSQPFFTGFIQGYNTLDALASLAFGIIVIGTLRNKGVNEPKNIAMDTVKSGILTVILMGLIYSLLAYMGAMSVGQLTVSANGGIALAQITHYYLGSFGSVVVAAIVIVACLKTAIGLISSFSETFVGLFPKGKYLVFAIVVSAMACLFANAGLTKIIEFSIPVLMFLYPLAMT
ncbi:MAG: branched-chain amino acid transport system II carrier protein, partial [Anaerorhabdus sp.]